jgi:hypothetical protein
VSWEDEQRELTAAFAAGGAVFPAARRRPLRALVRTESRERGKEVKAMEDAGKLNLLPLLAVAALVAAALTLWATGAFAAGGSSSSEATRRPAHRSRHSPATTAPSVIVVVAVRAAAPTTDRTRADRASGTCS